MVERSFGTTPEEVEFEKELEMFRTEVEQAKQFFFAELTINAEAGEDERILAFMNRTPLLWNTMQYALVKGTFVALGRIFDTDPNVHGIARLLRLVDKQKDMFSRSALATRKPAFPNFAAAAHEPTVEQFRDLKRDISRWRNIFEHQYKPLRSRFYAHRERAVPVEQLFEGTRIDQVEEMLAFLGSVHTALWQAFVNGEELRLTPEPHSVHEMRKQAAKGREGSTAQEHIVKQAREFMRHAARLE